MVCKSGHPNGHMNNGCGLNTFSSLIRIDQEKRKKNPFLTGLILKEPWCSGGQSGQPQGPQQDPCVLRVRGGRPEPALHLPRGGQGHGQCQAGGEGRRGGQGAGRRHATGALLGKACCK